MYILALTILLKKTSSPSPASEHEVCFHPPQEFPSLSAAGVDLLTSMLTYDPSKRITASAALRHEYFTQLPYPLPLDDMPKFPSAHDAIPSSRHAQR